MKHRRTTRWTSIADALTAGRRTVVTSVAAALTVGAATVAAVTGVTPAAQADDHGGIVMLGDSYFANTTLPQVVGALTGLGEQGCVKGEYRPATEVGRITGAPVQDFSCNGTRLYGEGNVIDAHIDEAVRAGALNPGTAFMPVMIGANDGLASNGAIDPGAAAQGFDRVAQRVRAAAPNARLLFVSYPSITNDRGNTCPLRLNGLPPTELPVGSIGATENLLWELARDGAARNGAEFLDLRAQTRGHDMCQPGGQAWVAGVVDTQTPQYNLMVHLSGDGVRNAAEQIAARY